MKVKEGLEAMTFEFEEHEPYPGKRVFVMGEHSPEGFRPSLYTMHWETGEKGEKHRLHQIEEEIKPTLISYIKQNSPTKFIIDERDLFDEQETMVILKKKSSKGYNLAALKKSPTCTRTHTK